MIDLLQQDKSNIWHPFTALEGADEPLLITAANGIYLHTHDGRKIIDGISSWWVNLHGHSNAAIAKAVSEQATRLEHVIFAGFTHEPAITLANNLLSILPGDQSKIFFSDNGSTAVEVALKMALQYWYNRNEVRKKVVAFKGAYHGDTFGSMSVGERGLFTKPFFPFLFDVDFIEFPTEENEAEVAAEFISIVDQGNVACFIFEPLIQAAGGMRTYSPSVLNNLIDYARRENVICIADEVFTGFGRTGRFFASEHLDHSPDIIALSKGLTGGTLPLGVTSCSKKIVEAYRNSEFSKTFFHGHSYTANPLACAAANASFELLVSSECRDNILRISDKHKNFVKELKRNNNVKNPRSLGTILAFEIAVGETSYENSIRKSIYSFFLERDILLRPLGNVIYIVPPYVITDPELDLIYDCIDAFLKSL
ncbi:MAG TPA: adenosylmethionine--8-amino-7-oxononanoate transaminase [Cyclobacteriaceae bacterium]|nr:adenosylmethionine--8-amino-7-oxononanoate transaminase [Cyclobacteriaceae bacterium]